MGHLWKREAGARGLKPFCTALLKKLNFILKSKKHFDQRRLDVSPAPLATLSLPFKCKWFSHKPQYTKHLKSSCGQQLHLITGTAYLFPLTCSFSLFFVSQIPKSSLSSHPAASGHVFSYSLEVLFPHHCLTLNSFLVRWFYRP